MKLIERKQLPNGHNGFFFHISIEELEVIDLVLQNYPEENFYPGLFDHHIFSGLRTSFALFFDRLGSKPNYKQRPLIEKLIDMKDERDHYCHRLILTTKQFTLLRVLLYSVSQSACKKKKIQGQHGHYHCRQNLPILADKNYRKRLHLLEGIAHTLRESSI